MRLGHLEVPVTDPLRSLAWYEEVLGFELVSNQGDRYVWIRLGEAEVLLRPGFGGVPEDPLAAVNLVLYADDLEAAARGLAARGASFERRGACLHLRDPDGHWIQVVDPGADHSGS